MLSLIFVWKIRIQNPELGIGMKMLRIPVAIAAFVVSITFDFI